MLLEDLKLNIRTARANSRARAAAAPAEKTEATAHRSQFSTWRTGRPLVGSILTIVAGVEMFFSGQLDVGNIHISVGIEGLQSTIIPVILVTLGILTMFMPQHRIFYGVISLVVTVYSLIGLNLGGFFVGMILGAVGGILIVSWMPKKTAPIEAADVDGGNETMDSSAMDSEAMDADNVDHEDAAAEPRPLVGSRS